VFMRSVGANVAFIAPGSTTAQGVRRLLNGTFEAAGEPRQLNRWGFAV
jgi:gamma-glutamyltranspeptidase/glutathione hydrolase